MSDRHEELLRTVRVLIHGRVQGVWYRDWTKRTALELGLSGWVRNRLDHSVEALFSGPSEQVEEMLTRCHDGSPMSHVEAVEVMEQGGEAPLGFEILTTA